MLAFFKIYLAIVALMSLVCFAMYGWDKRQAQKNGWRTPERTLHTLSLFGGWPGALLGQKVFRHKTQKAGFKAMTYLIIAVHVLLIAIVIYYR